MSREGTWWRFTKAVGDRPELQHLFVIPPMHKVIANGENKATLSVEDGWLRVFTRKACGTDGFGRIRYADWQAVIPCGKRCKPEDILASYVKAYSAIADRTRHDATVAKAAAEVALLQRLRLQSPESAWYLLQGTDVVNGKVKIQVWDRWYTPEQVRAVRDLLKSFDGP